MLKYKCADSYRAKKYSVEIGYAKAMEDVAHASASPYREAIFGRCGSNHDGTE